MSKTILLVDDEKVLRTLLRIALSRRGFQVLEAGGAAGALAVSRRCPDTIDLLVTELALAGPGGDELAGILTGERPDMERLFLARRPGSKAATDCAPHVLAKPFSLNTFLDRVEDKLRPRRKPVAGEANGQQQSSAAG